MLADADYLVGVRVTIVINGWRLWVIWLRIDHNGVGAYTLYLPLNYEIKIASYLSSFLYYILIYNLSFIYYHHSINYFYEFGVHLVVLMSEVWQVGPMHIGAWS